MNILLTGSTGLLGQKILSLVSKYKQIDRVTATQRGDKKTLDKKLVNSKKIEYKSMDITSLNEVVYTVKQCNPDLIIHCAAMTFVDECEENWRKCYDSNIKGTKIIIQTAKKMDCFVVFLSSDFVFGNLIKKYHSKINENNAKLTPLSEYGLTKLVSEHSLQISELKHSIIRTSLVYGISKNKTRQNILTWIIDNLQQSKAINVITDQWRTPTYIYDLAIACLKISTQKIEGLIHISGKDILTPYEFAIIVADVFGFDNRLIKPITTKKLKQSAQRPNYSALDTSKATKLLQYTPHSVRDALIKIKNTL